MSTENSHDAPLPSNQSQPDSPGPLLWSVVTVCCTTALGGMVGLGVGAALGTTAPEYYRSAFSRGTQPDFDPVAVGIGQGLTQGTVFGGIVGLVLVGLFYWYRTRTGR